MTAAVIVGVCVVLLILAFLLPRLSRHPQRATHKTFGTGGRIAGKAPGPLGKLGRKPFTSANKWSSRSASKGRRGRSRLPF